MSMRTAGCANRKFIAGIKLCPPARNFASSPYSALSVSACSSEVAAIYLKAAGFMALATNQNAVSALLASRFSKYEVRPRASQKAAPFSLSEKPIAICLTPIVFLAHNFSACASTGAFFAAASICGRKSRSRRSREWLFTGLSRLPSARPRFGIHPIEPDSAGSSSFGVSHEKTIGTGRRHHNGPLADGSARGGRRHHPAEVGRAGPVRRLLRGQGQGLLQGGRARRHDQTGWSGR